MAQQRQAEMQERVEPGHHSAREDPVRYPGHTPPRHRETALPRARSMPSDIDDETAMQMEGSTSSASPPASWICIRRPFASTSGWG